jgi:hypothetical protein
MALYLDPYERCVADPARLGQCKQPVGVSSEDLELQQHNRERHRLMLSVT